VESYGGGVQQHEPSWKPRGDNSRPPPQRILVIAIFTKISDIKSRQWTVGTGVLSFREKLDRRKPHLEACFFPTVRKALLSRILYLYIVTLLRHRIKSRTGLRQSIFACDQHEGTFPIRQVRCEAVWTTELMAFERLTTFPKSNVSNSRARPALGRSHPSSSGLPRPGTTHLDDDGRHSFSPPS